MMGGEVWNNLSSILLKSGHQKYSSVQTYLVLYNIPFVFFNNIQY